uniref:Uncharacterized protein n=1 Tax=Arundo donax TaxID=35708 RepID=A0A0A9E8S6_ARUDO
MMMASLICSTSPPIM